MTKPPQPISTDADLVPEIRDRWSPVVFSSQEPDQNVIHVLFEAARFAPSSFNEQPWLFVYALKGDGDSRVNLEALLTEGNAWAKEAGMLMISFYKTVFARNGKPNRVALHDVGAANFALTLQATKMGLITHQMAGFEESGANAALGVPEEYVAASMMAVGYPGDKASAPADLVKREENPRTRKSVGEFVFSGRYGR